MRQAERSWHGQPLLLAALAISACLHFLQWHTSTSGRRQQASCTGITGIIPGRHLADPEHNVDDATTVQDCASVACPLLFTANVETGSSVIAPMLADTRFRAHPPRDMLELTRLLYGATARPREPFLGFTNPFGRQPNLNYQWTQLTESMLTQAFSLLPGGGRHARLVVEVGSFLGRSSARIAQWLRRWDRDTHADGRITPLLCIDTWIGDLGMLLGQIFPEEMGRRNGLPTLYHVWLLNMMSGNVTERVLPLVAPSLLGARALAYLRLAADVIYLDSAHEMRETFMELTSYWPLVRPGGLLVGDDFNWRAVSHDVQLFARTHGLALRSFDGCHEALSTAKGAGRLCVWYFQKSAKEQVDRKPERRPAMNDWHRFEVAPSTRR